MFPLYYWVVFTKKQQAVTKRVDFFSIWFKFPKLIFSYFCGNVHNKLPWKHRGFDKKFQIKSFFFQITPYLQTKFLMGLIFWTNWGPDQRKSKSQFSDDLKKKIKKYRFQFVVWNQTLVLHDTVPKTSPQPHQVLDIDLLTPCLPARRAGCEWSEWNWSEVKWVKWGYPFLVLWFSWNFYIL